MARLAEVARRRRRRKAPLPRAAGRLVEPLERLIDRDLGDDLGARRNVAELLREQVGALLLDESGGAPLDDRVFEALASRRSLVDLTDDAPIRLISLYAMELPKGGTTASFVSNVANWASLPGDLRERLAPLHVRHRHESRLAGDWPVFIADHPLCKPHARTAAPMLFVTEYHASRILELDEAESAAMLARLFAHSYAEHRVYTHHWQPHDLLIWDNLAAQHARCERADPAAGQRAVRRVVISDVTFPELIERARRQQAERADAV